MTRKMTQKKLQHESKGPQDNDNNNVSLRYKSTTRHFIRHVMIFLDLSTTNTIHRHIRSDHSNVPDHTVYVFKYVFYIIFQPYFYSFTLRVSASFYVLLNYIAACEKCSPPHVFYHFIHHLFSLSIPLFVHMLSFLLLHIDAQTICQLPLEVRYSAQCLRIRREDGCRDEQKKNSKT